MFKGEITVRELVRQLAYSDEFATRIMLGLPLAEVAHGLFNRFLARPAEDDMTARQSALRILATVGARRSTGSSIAVNT